MEVFSRRFDEGLREFTTIQRGDEMLDYQDSTGSICRAQQ